MTLERPSRADAASIADALTLVTTFDGVTSDEALRRLVGYGELVFRTVRLEGGEVLVRHGDAIDRTVLLGPRGELIVRDVLVWMRPAEPEIACACAFPGEAVAGGLNQLISIARCGRWPIADLVQDNDAARCPACRRVARRWRGWHR